MQLIDVGKLYGGVAQLLQVVSDTTADGLTLVVRQEAADLVEI